MDNSRAMALTFRVIAHIALAGLALVLPGVGPNRFWAAGLLVGVGSPLAILINLRVKELSRNWAEALLDLLLVVTLIHLLPHLWMVLLCLGLMIALAPSVSLHPASHWIYLGFGALLLTGITFAVLVHDVQGWELPLIAVAVTYPSMLYYTYSQMQRSNELRQRANLLRGMTQLAGSVAHDFNNMLATVTGHSELAQLKLEKDHPARDNIQQALEGAEQAALLSRQLLNFSGRDAQHQDRVNLTAEARALVSLLEPAMPAGVELKIEDSDDLYIAAEVLQVHQVLMNVILNAGEAMIGRTGEIVIRLNPVTVEGDDLVRLLVQDRGPGLPRTMSSQIFEPFMNSKEDAHGLDLASTQKIMADLGGTIHYLSNTSGTQVVLSWTAVAPDSTDKPSQHNSAIEITELSKPTNQILVVDDDARVRAAATNMLEHMGFNTLAASDAFEAQSILQARLDKISAVILDLKMPIKNGWECLQDLREISPNTPVIICSGFDPQNNMQSMLNEDVNLSFLQKPYRVDDLVRTLNRML